MQPAFEQIVSVVRLVSQQARFEPLRLVLASTDGEVRYREVLDSPEFEVELHRELDSGFLALGLIGWEMIEGREQARSMLFKWHTDERLKELFDRLCEAGVDSSDNNR